MEARYFRYLFENVSDGIIQWGYVNDTRMRDKAYYVYLSENNLQWVHKNKATVEALRHLPKKEIDILVLGEFKAFYIMSFIEILKTRRVHTVVLPYIMPRQRKVLSDSLPFPEDVKNFILRPYSTLVQMGVRKIHYLYGNGKDITSNPDGLPEGEFFEEAETEIIEKVEDLEGCRIPLKKAGYIVKCDWLFYFGVYGSGNNEEIQTEHLKETGSAPEIQTTVTMFSGPLHDAPVYVDSLFTEKIFSKDMPCLRNTDTEDCVCDMRCMRFQDHTMLKQHTKQERKGSCFGVLLLGNVNLKRYLADVTRRYHSIGKRIRILTIPDGASLDKWNPQILALFSGSDFHYWLAAMNSRSSGEVLKDIMFSNSHHHLVQVSAEFGSCFSGYLVDKNE